MHLYCDYCTWLQAKLYNGELLSSMSCAMVSVMLLVRIIFIDTSLHKPVDMFTELSFRLGTSEGISLGGVDTSNLHHHSIS